MKAITGMDKVPAHKQAIYASLLLLVKKQPTVSSRDAWSADPDRTVRKNMTVSYNR